jgi:hypothetical protein
MTVAEVLKQARALSIEERKELVKQLIDTLTLWPERIPDEPKEHWGKSLNRLSDEIGQIEMLYPEIEDPVEWTKHTRAEQRRRRLSMLGEE